MKNKLLLTLLAIVCALCCALGFAACDKKPSEPPHMHNYVWVDNGDGTHHSHCTNDGCDAPDLDPEKHVWLDGYCLVCRAEYLDPSVHRHVWEETWHHDSAHHWHNCTVDGCDVTDNAQKSGYGEHSYGADNNCVCGKRNPAVPSEGLKYGVELDNTVLIMGIDNTDVTDIVIPAEYEGKPVTSIKWEAFKSCYSLQSITLPDSIKSIGKNAFSNCRSLAEITLPNSLKSIGDGAFFDCRSLTKIVIPDSVSGLGEDAFYGCRSLTDVTIGSGVPSLQRRAFYQCSSLTSITIPDNVTSIGAICFNGCSSLASVTIGSGVAIIGEEAFSDCGALKTVTFAEGSKLTTVHEKAFKDAAIVTATIPAVACSYVKNSALKNVTINSGTKIPESAFSGCTSLKSVTIGDSITSIGTFAFRDCTSIKSITIPADVTIIEQSAFNGCRGITGVTFAEGSKLKSIEYSAFENCSNYGFTSIAIPDSVTKIGENAFSGCSSLAKLTIGSGLQNIGQSAFYNCGWLNEIRYTGNVAGWCRISGLNNIMNNNSKTLYIDGKKVEGELVIPDGVTSIPSYAFYRCSSITSVVVGDDVKSIGSYAFGEHSSLSSVTLGRSVANIYTEAFVSHWYGSAIDKLFYEGDIEDWCKISGLRYIMQDCNTIYFDGKEAAGELVIPNSITSIPEYAFYECGSLTSVIIPTSVTSIGANAFIGDSLTVYCEAAAEPDGWISSWTSYFCPVVWDCKNNDKDRNSNAYAVIGGIRYSLFKIGTTATATVIQQPHNIVTANIPATVTYKDATYKVDMNPEAFNRCNLLESITVDANIENYASQDGILYNKDKTEFVHVPKLISGSITISNSMTSIKGGAFSDCKLLTSVTIPSSVTSIESNAFDGCTGLTSITVPDSVTGVKIYAFSECIATIYCEAAAKPDGWDDHWDEYFHGAVVWDCNNNNKDENGYEYAVIDGMLYALKDGHAIVARQPQNIATANILDEVTYKDATYNVIGIAPYAFYNCAYKYNEYDNALYLGNSTNPYVVLVQAKDTSITSCTIHENTKFIYDRAFYNCENLATVVLPDGLMSIGQDAFWDCRKLTSVTIGDNVTVIGAGAFCWCDSLTTVTMGNSVTTIGASAFNSCTNLTSITIPESVTVIGAEAFSNCRLLIIYCEAAAKPDGWADNWNNDSSCPVVWNSETNDKDADGYAYTVVEGIRYSLKDGEATVLKQSYNIVSANIPATVTYKSATYKVTTIVSNAFWNCKLLTEVTVGDNVTTLNDNVFDMCTSLTKVTLGKGVKVISSGAFNTCSALVELTMGNGVTNIENSVFDGCELLTNITFNGTKAQWNAINKPYHWGSNFDNCVVHCTDGDVEIKN